MAPLEAMAMRPGEKQQNLTQLLVCREADGVEKRSRYC